MKTVYPETQSRDEAPKVAQIAFNILPPWPNLRKTTAIN